MIFLFANNAAAELAQAVTGLDTTLQVDPGQGGFFPSPGVNQAYVIVVQDGATWEIMHVTSVSGDVLTVVRARDGTTAQNFSVGAVVELRVTRGLLDNFIQQDEADATFLKIGDAKEEAFATGTRALFSQTTAPLFWTKDVNATLHDRALRVTTGVVANGGALNFSAAFVSRALSGTVQGTTLSGSELPFHSHSMTPAFAGSHIAFANNGTLFMYPVLTDSGPGFIGLGGVGTAGIGGSQPHVHGLSLNALDLNVKYSDAIIATKDAP